MNTIQDAWLNYKSKVVPDSACEIQVNETKQAFYAGSLCAFSLLGTVAEKYTEEQGANILEGIDKELADFFILYSA